MFFKKPVIISFDARMQSRLLAKVVRYINQEGIQSISILNLPTAKTVKIIKAKFISLDLDIFSLTPRTLQNFKKIQSSIGQVRIMVNTELTADFIEPALSSFSNLYKKSKILYIEVSENNFDKEQFLSIITAAQKKDFIPSVYLDGISKHSIVYKNIIQVLRPYKDAILKDVFFIDDPSLFKKITGLESVCPAKNIMFHFDKNGNYFHCRYGETILGSIQEKSVAPAWADKLKAPKNKNCDVASKKENYTIISHYYDALTAIGSAKIHRQYLEELRDLSDRRDQKIIDFACGSGNLLVKLAESYNQICGVEKSKQMAAEARRKTNVPIFVSDFEHCKISPRTFFALCTYDSLNYLNRPALFEKGIKNIARNILPKGFLLFDMNIPNKFKTHWDISENVQIGDASINVISSYRKPYWRIVFEFRKADKIFYETHFERFYTKTEIKRILTQNNLKILKFCEGAFNASQTGKRGRLFVLAQKK